MNRRISSLFFGSLCLLLLIRPAIGQESSKPRAMPKLPGVDAAMEEMVASGEISGAVTLVASHGRIVHLGAIGLADIDAKRPMRPATMFSIASMTKPIVATAVMILVDEGKLSVDDKVSKHLPAFQDLKLKDGEPAAREITIRDILTHTSGLAGNQIFEGSLADAVDELATRPLAFQPGTQWKYSPGLNVAGRIIEVVSEQPLEEFLQERIFTPLEMTSTTFRPTRQQRRRLATIYMPGEQPGTLAATENHITDLETTANPSGGLISTAHDLFRFYKMVLGGGKLGQTRILSPEAVDRMTSPQTGDLETGFTPGNCWGLGWCIVRQPQEVTAMLAPGTYGHGGAFGTQGWVDPVNERICVMLIQRRNFGNGDASIVRQVFQQAAADALKGE